MHGLLGLRYAVADAVACAASPAAGARAAWRLADEVVNEAPERARWACRLGCAACCHLRVEVSTGEADAMADEVRRTFSGSARVALRERLERGASAARALDAGTYRRRGLRCAFLEEGERCGVYAARPAACRVHASFDAVPCSDASAGVPLDAWLVKVGAALGAGLGDTRTELHAGVLDALGSPRSTD